MAKGEPRETLISFESGHYKKVIGEWKGDAVWMHIKKDGGGMVHINKDKVEYAETFGPDTKAFEKDKHDDDTGPTDLEDLEKRHMKAEIGLINARAEEIKKGIKHD